MSTGRQMMGLNPKFVSSDVNLFLLPYMDEKDNRKTEGECFLSNDNINKKLINVLP